MATLHDILSTEATNASAIYLYEQSDRWFAYEHSAYHFCRIFDMGEVLSSSGQVCVALDNRLDFLHSAAICPIEVTAVADSEIQIACATAFTGFEQWKKEQLN